MFDTKMSAKGPLGLPTMVLKIPIMILGEKNNSDYVSLRGNDLHHKRLNISTLCVSFGRQSNLLRKHFKNIQMC